MERIVLEVDDATGKFYRNFSPESKKKFDLAIKLLLKKAVNDAHGDSYKKFLDEIGAEAAAKGLTPEILNELLHSDD